MTEPTYVYTTYIATTPRVEPPWVLSSTFQTEQNHAAGHGPTRVVFEARPFGEVITLTVTHDEFPAGEAGIKFRRDISQGWPAILSSLKTLLESGQPLNFPAPFAPKRPISA